jgi:hypothetical protein
MVLVATLTAVSAPPAQALRVTTWNLLNYPGLNLAGRQPHFRTVMTALQTDVMVVQELHSLAGADSFLNVLKTAQPKPWGRSYIALAESAVYWDSSKVDVTNVSSFKPPSGPRAVLICVVKPLGYASKQAWFRVYSVHFKAGPTMADSTQRRLECGELRANINSINPTSSVGPNFVLGGDSNFYGAFEGGYLRLTESQADDDGRSKDPLLMPGPWNNNSGYAIYHTQSPCLTAPCPGSNGGMDDRFDLWFSSYSMQDGQGLDLVLPGGYIAYGQDGQHFNNDINGAGFNNAVGYTVASSLREAADHLPVIITVQLPSRVVAASELNFGDVITGATAEQNLAVSNGAVAPADALDYSFAAPAGFTAPGGGFSDAAGGSANNHTIGMDTAVIGAKSGTLTVTTDDPDSLAKPVSLSGRVLAHAAASLDSASMTAATLVDLGQRPTGTFQDRDVRVHNFGYDPLQARLAVSSGVITGGAGRFSLVGGFTPALLAGTGKSYTVHFDDSGATQDSTYEATLTFQSSDEPLPGAAAAANLVVTLRAQPTSGPVSAPDALPLALRFYAPHPNPFSGATRFAYDLPQAAPVSLQIFDLSGRRVASLVSESRGAGHHQEHWLGTDASGARVPAGLYFARFSVLGFTRSRRIAVLP